MPFEATTRTSRDVGTLRHVTNIAHVCVMTMIYLSLFRPIFELGFLLTHQWCSGAGMFGEPKNNFQTYRPINDPGPSIFVVGSVLMGKELLVELKCAILIIGSKSIQKW